MNTPRLFLPMPMHWTQQMDMEGCFMTEIPANSTRVFWDGGLSRDFPRPTWDWGPDLGTGLFDERGLVVQAPEYFLNALPCLPLDGYLHEVDGKTVLSVIGLPNSTQFFKLGDILAGDRLIRLDADAVFDLCTNASVASDWRQASDESVFSNEMYHAMEILTDGPAQVALFKQVTSEHKFSHNGGKSFLFRTPGSAWNCSLMSSWVELNPHSCVVTDVVFVDSKTIRTMHGAFNGLDQLVVLPVPGQTVLAFINRYGFITGIEPIGSN